MISAKRPVTDQHGRTYCTEEHRAQYLLAHPKRCDECNAKVGEHQITIRSYTFCGSVCMQTHLSGIAA